MQVDQIQHAILYNALKMNMFLIIRVKHAHQALTILQDIWQMDLTQYVIVSFVTITIVCQITNRVQCPPGTYNAAGDDASGPDVQHAILYNALKMNMFPIIHVKLVPQELIMRLGIWQVDLTQYVMYPL